MIVYFARYFADMPTWTIVVGTVIGGFLIPPYQSDVVLHVAHYAPAWICTISSWFLARWVSRKILTKKGIPYAR